MRTPAVAVLLLLLAAAGGRARAEEPAPLRDAPGRDATQANCSICHTAEYIPMNAPAMDRAGWQKSLQKMRERFGAPLSDADAQTVLEYLSANYAGKGG
ncbi:MAG: cytochrome c [Gammaproteobacteria bacterium]|nr:cytochrome c [Gammaproteobacteria bacterium]MBV9697949.1 cytochrome c [Gammaproteobacteria bacterium]